MEGELVAATPQEVKKALAQQGLYPVAVSSKVLSVSWADLPWNKKVKIKDLLSFTRQLKVMFKAGLPISQIFETLIRQTSHVELKSVIKKVQTDVSQGSSLTKAFSKHPHIFNSLYTSMLAVGEVGGVLDTILTSLSDMLLNEHRILSKLKSATLYPKIVLGALVAVTVGMMLFVIPTFSDFYAMHQAVLPLPTQILIGASHAVVQFWYMGVLLLVGGYVGWKKLLQTSSGKKLWATIQYRIPVFGELQKLVANARFASLMSSLYQSGVPISRSLEIVSETVENVLFSSEVRHVKNQMARGKSLSAAMAGSRYFTPMVVETTGVGEKTGSLGEVLRSCADFYHEEVDGMLKNLTTLVEPLLLFGIFGVVGLLALAIFLPVWNLSQVVMPTR